MPIKAFFMSLGMFSIFPVRNSWDDKLSHLVIPMLPAVGLVIGLAWYGIALLSGGLPDMLRSAVILLTPFILCGFIHTDGYMDTADAVFSRRSLDERRRILKDSHTGAFAVIAVVCLFMLQFCAVNTIASEEKPLAALVFIPVLSRSVAGVAMLSLKPISQEGYAAAFRAGTTSRHTAAAAGFIPLCFALACTGGISALITLGFTSFAAVCATAYVYKQLQGMSGDLCGCIISVSELAGLICMACV